MGIKSLKTSLEEGFGCIKGPRINDKTDHKRIDIITIATMAVLCGTEGWVVGETDEVSKKE
ncbi:MAG: Tnp 1-associated [Cyanobacteriota bacterium]